MTKSTTKPNPSSDQKKLNASFEFILSLDRQLRTPLSTILGMLEVLDRNQLNPEQQANLGSIQSAATEISVLLTDLQKIIESESSSQPLKTEPFSLSQLHGLVQDRLTEAKKAEEVNASLTFDTKLPEHLVGDANMMAEIISGVIAYTKDLSKSRTEAELKLSQQSGKRLILKLSITQSAVHASTGDLAKEIDITEGFAKSKCVGQRAGFRLALAKSLLTHFKSKLEWTISNETICFSSYLECAIDDQAQVTRASGHSKTNSLDGKRILVVEDIELNQLVTRLMLESFGCRVEIAVNGQKAIEEYSPEQYDCVIMDIEMPVMDGIEATRILREKFGNETVIIGLSADALGNDPAYYLQSGFTDYITKPVKKEFLASKIMHWTSQQPETVD